MFPHQSSVLEDRHSESATAAELKDSALSRARMRRLRAMFPGEFDKPLTLAVSFASIKKILSETSLSGEEREYLRKYVISRERYESNDTPDATRFSGDFETTLARLFASENRSAADMLAYLGPRIIHERYGEGVLFWAWQNLTVGVVNEHVRFAFTRYVSQFSDIVGTSERFEYLMKARYTLWRTHGTSDLADTLALYDLFVRLPDFVERENRAGLPNGFSGLVLESVASIRDYERGRVREWEWKDVSPKGRDLSEEVGALDTRSFHLEPEERAYGKTVDWSGRSYKLYLDSPVGVILRSGGFPIAMAWFSLRDSDTLFVNQFQQTAFDAYDRYGRAVWNRVDDLAKKLPWQEFFFDLLMKLAKESGCSKIVLQSWENNVWTETPREALDEEDGRTVQVLTDVPYLSQTIAMKIYDSFARAHGFKRESEYGDWVKRVE